MCIDRIHLIMVAGSNLKLTPGFYRFTVHVLYITDVQSSFTHAKANKILSSSNDNVKAS